MSDTLRNFADKWLAAWTGNQPEALLRFYTPDAYYADPANTNGLKGHEQLAAYFGKLLKRNPGWEWKVVELFETKGGFTLKWQASIPVPGKVLELEGLDIVELRDGHIARNEVFFDRHNWITALGG
jgi:steroid delta-isomerase-like uncharacterized protein